MPLLRVIRPGMLTTVQDLGRWGHQHQGVPVGGPMEYLTNLSLQLKMLVVLIAGINLAALYFTGVQRRLEAVPADGDAPGGAKAIAAVSLTAWIFVIIFGRFIMYNDTLLYALGL